MFALYRFIYSKEDLHISRVKQNISNALYYFRLRMFVLVYFLGLKLDAGTTFQISECYHRRKRWINRTKERLQYDTKIINLNFEDDLYP